MCNPKTTNEKYTTQMTLLPECEEKEVPKRKLAPTFKPYNHRQVHTILDIESLIPAHHPARVVDEIVESVPDDQLFSHYKGGGRSSFHPKMMLKIILFGYSQKVYSCRGIEKLIHESVPAMWLASMQAPDFRTINEFRGVRMKHLMDTLFESMIHQLIEQHLITMDNYFLDGTKIEADANKYSFVWKKATTRFEAQLKEKIKETLDHIHELTQLEAGTDSPTNGQSETVEDVLGKAAEELEIQVEKLNRDITLEADTGVRKELRKKRSHYSKPLKLIRENFLPRLATYQKQMETFGDRNSYSKTDQDATFMRMKEDPMKNGQLKPGYNVQLGTENQFILFYFIHQRPTDTRCFIPHLEKLAASSLPMPKTVVADAGYGSEENYLYAIGDEKEKRFDFLIPYGTYLFEQRRAYKNDLKNAKNWAYDEKKDSFTCPDGRNVPFSHYQTRKNASGFEQNYKIYECEDCTDCPLKSACTKASGNRQVHWNPVYEEMKNKAKTALECDEKAMVYARRKVEVESVFGHLKGNRSFRRFSLRGLDKVQVEFGILAMAHNILKLAGIRQRVSTPPNNDQKNTARNHKGFLAVFYFRDLSDSPLELLHENIRIPFKFVSFHPFLLNILWRLLTCRQLLN